MVSLSTLVVGLGNPGSEYERTRHNVGFMALDALAEYFHCGAWKKKFKGLITAPADKKIIFLKPNTYMNLSGEAVVEAAQFHKIEPKEIIVFHDDIDLLPGQVKIKQGGGAGGHNGLKSIDAHVGPDYWRVRLGVGHPGVKGDAVMNYVLSPFAKVDQHWLDPLLDEIAKNFEMMLDGKTKEYAKILCQTRGESA